MLKVGGGGISVLNGISVGGGGISLPGAGFSKYAYYVDFQTGFLPRDRVSNNFLSNDFSAGRPLLVNGVYTEFGVDVPAINELGLNTYGAFTLLNGKTNDISSTYWVKGLSPIITGVEGFQASQQFSNIRTTIATLDGVDYIISMYLRVEQGGQTTGYFIDHQQSATGNESSVSISEIRDKYYFKVLGKSGGGNITFGFEDGNVSNWSKVFIDTINVTQSTYPLPEVQNDTTGAVSIALNYADADEGTKMAFADAPKLFDALDGIGPADAQGKMIVPITPLFNAGDIGADVNILDIDGTGLFFIYDDVNNELEVTDGTNTTKVDYVPVSGVTVNAVIDYGDDSGQKMRISVDATVGSKVTMLGTFGPDTHLSHSWEEAAWFAVGSVIIEKESGL